MPASDKGVSVSLPGAGCRFIGIAACDVATGAGGCARGRHECRCASRYGPPILLVQLIGGIDAILAAAAAAGLRSTGTSGRWKLRSVIRRTGGC